MISDVRKKIHIRVPLSFPPSLDPPPPPLPPLGTEVFIYLWGEVA